MTNWSNAKKFVPSCSKCDDWNKRGLSDRCPSCDSEIIETFERLERNEFITVYYYQDGKDFYMYLKEDDVKSDAPDALWRVYTSPDKFYDWDIVAATKAHTKFKKVYCAEYKLTPIKLKMF